ncbi:MAG TPA: ABC transporter permease [Chitinophagaceae bacterium]|nr:ABC transporter permease [Chitinophagaceae bacterium]
MFKQHLKISLRNLWKNKTFSLINFIGLSLGFASVLTLGSLVYHYFTTDNIHENKGRMYYLKSYAPDGSSYSATTFPLLYEVQKSAPEVEAATHIQSWNWPWLKQGSRETQENTIYVDTGFFKVFSFPLKEGVAEVALREKYSLVISQKVAAALFGREPAVGKTIMADDSIALTVTGVLADIPSNSSIKADVILSLELLKDNKDFLEGANWYNTFADNYLVLQNGANPATLDAKIRRVVQQFYAPEHKGSTVKTAPFSEKRDEAGATIKAIISSAIAASIFILIIVVVNLLNLNAATMFSRTKEVAVRQMVGSGRRSIVAQFCIENAVVILFSLGAGFILFLNLLLPQVNAIIGIRFGELQFQWDHNYPVVLVFSSLAVAVILVAGTYPALHLTSLKVTDAIKGKLAGKTANSIGRNVFIGVQFVLAVVVICVAIVFNSQIRYMKSAALGFNKENLIVANLDMAFKDPKLAETRFTSILNSLYANPHVKAVSTSREIPTAYWQNYNDYVDVETGKKVNMRQSATDAGYAEAYQIPVVYGRNFNVNLTAAEEKSVLLNQTAAKAFGWTNPVGKQLRSSGSNEVYTVVGVLNDFHYEDLQQPIGPLLHGYSGKPGIDKKYLSIRVDGQHAKSVVSQLENEFKSIPSRRLFTYQFMSDLVDEQYALLTGILKITNYVALLTIIIACMGMFGLISIFAGRRTKEIGIRKVLGASIANIASLVSKDFIKVVVAAVVIAIPVAGWLMHRWLQDFAYRLDMKWWMFALGSVIAVLIALLTVSFQAIKAARANPVKSLRTE